MAELGRAYIEVHADTRPFGRELQQDVDKYLVAAQAQMNEGGKKMGKNFSDGFGPEAKKGLDGTVKEFEKFGSKLDTTTKRAGSSIRKNIKKGLDDVDRDTRNWGSRLLSYLTSWAVNSVTNFQGFGSGAMKAFDGAAGSAGTFVAIIGAIIALILILIPLIDALIGVLLPLTGLVIGVGIAFSPVLLVFKELSNILPVLTSSQKDFNAELKKLNPALKPLAEVLRTIALAVKALPIGNFIAEIVPPLQIMAKFFQSKQFRTAFAQLAEDAGQFLGFLLLIFETPAMGHAFFLFLKTIGTVMAFFEQALLVVGKTLSDVFNDPGVQAAIVKLAQILSAVVITFANWLDRASKDGSLDRFLNDALMILDDLFGILTEVAGLMNALATPENMKSLHEFLKFVATTLHEISGYLATKNGQRFMHDLYVGAELAVVALTLIVILLAGIDNAFHDIGKVGKVIWTGIKVAAVATLNTVIGYVNALVSAINGLISALNAIPGVNIPKIPKIPKVGGGGSKGGSSGGAQTGHQDAPPAPPLMHGLASGGIVRDPTLTWVGEQSRPEVVIPLTQPNRARQLAQESGLTGMLHQSNQITVQVDLDGEPFYEYTAKAIDQVGQDLMTGPRS